MAFSSSRHHFTKLKRLSCVQDTGLQIRWGFLENIRVNQCQNPYQSQPNQLLFIKNFLQKFGVFNNAFYIAA
jgi:hypothetical protein